MPDILIYNSMSGAKENFVPIRDGKVGIYCCGPTTYNYIHIGNGRPMVVFDTVRRYLAYKGYDVTFVTNFTDVDDKIINRAQSEGEEAADLAERYIGAYFEDAHALGVLDADVHPKVSEHMSEIIAFIDALVQKGVAYPLDGDVYYSIADFPEYGKLSKRSRDDLLDGARVDVDQRKQNAGDFALWKKAKPGEPSWDSPWGPGRPGWHIECSAMSYKYLGESFDIHGGGADLIFPHHENEIAQSEGRFGHPMAKYWMHNGFITVNHEKMSKSLGNFFLLRDILDKFPGQVVRFYLLSVHYRSPIDFDDEQLTAAQKGLERLKNAARNATAFVEGDTRRDDGGANAFLTEAAQIKAQFEAAMEDDFNTALAVAALFDLARIMNAYAAEGCPEVFAIREGLNILVTMADILGLDLLDGSDAEEDGELNTALEALLAELGHPAGETRTAEEYMAALLALRQEYRKEKNFAGADKLRDALKALGIVVEDTAQGPRWHKA